MRRQSILSTLGACLLPLVAAVCGDPASRHSTLQAPTEVATPPEFAITDARDDAGMAHFYFLQPVDRRPKGQRLGPADRSLENNLALEICLWMGDHCAQPLLARYTKTSGVGKERLQLDDDDDYYKVRWYTSRFPSVDAGQTYHLTVLAAGVPLGSADVKIVKKNRDAKSLDKSEFVGLKDDEGLTIRFYIEKCGVFILPAAGGSATPCVSGSILATSNESVAVIVPDGAAAPNTKFTIAPATGAASDAGLAGGPFAFGPSGTDFAQPLTLSMSFDAGSLPSAIGEATLAAYELRDGAWHLAGPATVDADHNRLYVDVTHFSQYAVLAPVASIALAVPATPLGVGATGVATATVKDAAGRALEHRQLDWSVFPAGIVSVDQSGTLTALSPGEATVTVTSEGQRAAATVMVGAVRAASVTIGGGSNTPLIVGQTRQLSATAYDAHGAALSGRVITWTSSSDAIATVDANGLVTGATPGDATITATVDGVSASAPVTVAPLPVTSVVVSATGNGPLEIGATRQLSAGAFNGTTALTGRVVAWTSSDAGIVSVDATGLATAKAPGNATITATVEGVTGSLSLTAKLPTITAVTVTPGTATLVVGATQQLAAAVMAGTVAQTGRAIGWTSSSDAVATVDANGMVTARTVGSATITATVEGVSGTSAVTVKVPPVTAVNVTPAAATILVGAVQQLTGVAMAGAVPQPARVIAWTSSNDAIATVDANGLVTAKSVGSVTITGTVDAVSGSSAITVNPAITPVTAVVVTSTAIGPLDVGSTRQMTAAAYNGSTQLFGRTVAWSSSNTNAMTVDGSGLVTAVSAGSATITALVDGVAGTANVTTRGLMFGPYHIDQSLFAPPFTGALRELKPTDGIAMLNAARQAGYRLIITPVSGRSKFKDPVTGRFRLDLWKLQVDRFAGWDFRPYIQDGTIIGIYLIDEPMDPTNWVNKNACMTDGNTPTCLTDSTGAIIPDSGAAVSYADIEAAAAYAQRYFPGVPMGVGSRPSQLLAGAPFQYLNFGLAQYTTNKKDTQGTTLTASQFVASEVAAAKQAGLGVQLSINVIAGNGGAPVLPSQLRTWGLMMANEPYACALTLWKWDFVDGTNGDPFNSYWTNPTNVAVLNELAAAAGKRPPVPCRGR